MPTSTDTAPTVPITLHVPPSLAVAFQLGAAELLRGLLDGPPLEEAWPRPWRDVVGYDLWNGASWGSDDHDRARWIVQQLPLGPVRLLACLVAHAGARLSGDELGARAGYSNGARSVAPALGSVGRKCRQVGRRALWTWLEARDVADPSTYGMEAVAAALLEPALDERDPDWRASATGPAPIWR